MINEEAIRRFMAAPWLAEVEREPKQALLNALAEERAAAGTVLLSQGQPNDHLTFLIDGSVELERTFRQRPQGDHHDPDGTGRVRDDLVFPAQTPDGDGTCQDRRLDADASSSRP